VGAGDRHPGDLHLDPDLISHANRGLAIVTLPEAILYESQVAGIGVVEGGLDRVRELRAGRDSGGWSERCDAKEGVLSEQWQRPELYDSFYPKPRQGAAE
jgi:hypothetical protein